MQQIALATTMGAITVRNDLITNTLLFYLCANKTLISIITEGLRLAGGGGRREVAAIKVPSTT